MRVRECFLHAVALVSAEDDAREAWAAMNRANAPWAAVFSGDRLLGLLDGEDLGGAVRTPEVFAAAGELAAGERPARRALRLAPEGDLAEAALRMEMAGADAAYVEAPGRPPGVLALAAARAALGDS